MDANKRIMLIKGFIISQFSYFPYVSMFHSRNTENRINEIRERAFKSVHDGSSYLSFDQLLIKDKLVTIRQRRLQILATQFFKVKNDMSTGSTEDIFQFVDKPYNLRNNSILLRKK